jgi:tRNA-splicing ligase RtcB
MTDVTVFGSPVDQAALEQLENVMRDERAVKGALMADHHKGYSMPIGGVVAYQDAVSPTGVGFDIGCGNKAVRTNLNVGDFDLVTYPPAHTPEMGRVFTNNFKPFMRQIQKTVSFGLGRSSGENVDHSLFDEDVWNEIDANFGKDLKYKARQQLGTVGSGNHYVDLLVDEEDGQIWVANHFGSRGLGHTIASGFMAVAAGRGFTDRVPETEDAVVLDTTTDVGQFYIEAMNLAGDYAYAGRDYVAAQVLRILGAEETFSVHNHHNFAWLENGLWVVRKGATPLTSWPAFIGGSMGEASVIVRGKVNDSWGDTVSAQLPAVEDIGNLASAPHGAGRVMSRTKAAGKLRKMWTCPNRNCNFQPQRDEVGGGKCPLCKIPLRKIRMRDTSTAAIDWASTRYRLEQQGITVLGAGADEAPGVYKNLDEVLSAHPNIEVLNRLWPIGVVMASADERDPYKD